jgi:transketolase
MNNMSSIQLSKKIRAHALRMVFNAKASHIGSCLSCADILAVLYQDILTYESTKPDDSNRDIFIMSKGHAAAILYAVLAEKKFFPISWLDQYCQDGSSLAGHVSKHGVPGVEFSTGSLGHGLSVGCGFALAAKVENHRRKAYVLLSDGECDEGSIWEAVLFASHFELDNLVAIVDYNKIQSFGNVGDVMRLEPFSSKWLSFGWNVLEVDGHDHLILNEAFNSINNVINKPTVIIAHTIKGKGVSFMENQLLWHYRNPNHEQLEIALRELDVEK